MSWQTYLVRSQPLVATAAIFTSAALGGCETKTAVKVAPAAVPVPSASARPAPPVPPPATQPAVRPVATGALAKTTAIAEASADTPLAAPLPAGQFAEEVPLVPAAGALADAPARPIVVTARVVSSQYAEKQGGIERSIVAVWKQPGHDRVALENFAGEQVRLELPPGKYELVFSAVGSRGATFDVGKRQIQLAALDTPLDIGTIDLPLSKNARLYGEPAPQLTGIVGWKNTAPLALKELRGKLVVLDFFNYGCSICHAHKPDLVQLLKTFGDRGVVVLAIHDHSAASMEEMNERMDPILERIFRGKVPRFPMALDGPGKGVFDAYGVQAVPTVVLIDQQGRVVRRYHHAGVPDLKRDIEQLLASR